MASEILHLFADLIPLIFDLIKAICWPVVVYYIFKVSFPFLKEFLKVGADFIASISERGMKVTSLGLEIPSQHEAENLFDDISKPSQYYTSINEQSKAEISVSADLQENVSSDLRKDDVKTIMEKHQKWFADEVKSSVENFISAQPNSDSPVEINKILKGLVCDAYINLFFERIYQKMLASQVKVLFRFNKSSSYNLASSELEKFYGRQAVSKSIIFTDWLNFLQQTGFIKINDDIVTLTKLGLEFVKYIKTRGYSLDAKFG